MKKTELTKDQECNFLALKKIEDMTNDLAYVHNLTGLQLDEILIIVKKLAENQK